MSYIDQEIKNIRTAYADAIDRLMAGTVDYQALGVALAKANPTLFLELTDKATTAPTWAQQVADFVVAGNRVAAIKGLREHFGWFLKEAKDVADVATGYACIKLDKEYADAAAILKAELDRRGYPGFQKEDPERKPAIVTLGEVLKARINPDPDAWPEARTSAKPYTPETNDPF